MRKWSIAALVAAVAAVIIPGLLFASGQQPRGEEGAGLEVADRFWFLHRDLGREGSLTVRLTAMTGTITYPPPDHDEIVSGLVPWAKVGVIVKDGMQPGAPYAAVMMTGAHGVRFQHNYRHDVAGTPGGVSGQAPRWLRLTRSGDTITGFESADGAQWTAVGTAELDGLPDTVQIGLFATSPGDLTLRRVALGGAIEEVRFTQAVGVFDNVSPGGPWRSDPVGEMNRTDWERFHRASGAVEQGDVITISGTGDIGPLGEGPSAGSRVALLGLPIALIIVLVVAATAVPSRPPAVQALTLGAAGLLTGSIAVGVVVPVPRVVFGLGVAFGLWAIFAHQLRILFRRGWVAAVVAVSLIVMPYLVASVPLLPDPVSQWLLRVTPAAGFAAGQTIEQFPQVTAHYAPSAGYFPLPWWAGLLVVFAYPAALALGTAALWRRRRTRHENQTGAATTSRSPRRSAGVW